MRQNLKWLAVVAIVSFLLVPAFAGAADSEVVEVKTNGSRTAEPNEHVKPLERLIGTWRTPANLGETDEGLNSYNVFSWGLGGQMLASKTYTVADGQESLAYEAWQYWHPGEESLKLTEISADGTIYEGTLSVEGDVITYFWKAYAGERVIEFKQTITFEGDNRYLFAAFAKDGDNWRRVIGATFVKDAE